ncbi:MAG TPA: hypothetical protein VFE37_02730 [Chloroflexota bacterium]|nr:hypothetical protein [Chloroflexota bacterium]
MLYQLRAPITLAIGVALLLYVLSAGIATARPALFAAPADDEVPAIQDSLPPPQAAGPTNDATTVGNPSGTLQALDDPSSSPSPVAYPRHPEP